MNMFNLSTLASNVLNSMDNAAKETLEELPKISATKIRQQNAAENGNEMNNSRKYLSGGGSKEYFEPEDDMQANNSSTISMDISSHSSNNNSVNRLVSSSDEYMIGTPERSSHNSSSGNISLLNSQVLNARPPVAPVSSSGLAPLSANKTIMLASASDIDSETKKTLKKNKQEIERLNGEVLELERQCEDLKNEVREAWDSFKQAQERSAAVEGDLQEEVRQVSRAKAAEKQQVVAQMVKLNEEVSSVAKAVLAAQAERDELQSQLNAANETNDTWLAQVTHLNLELQEAKASTVQGVHSLREELRSSQVAAEQMRHDHNSVVRQNQVRLSQLEMENSELMRSLTASQKEVDLLRSGGASGYEASAPVDYMSRDYINMQSEVIRLSGALDTEREDRLESERRTKQLECEIRAAQLNLEDERRRNQATLQDMSKQLAQLEDKLRDNKKSSISSRPEGVFSGSIGGYLNGSISASAESLGTDNEAEGGTNEVVKNLERELAEAKGQAQNLSKLLLKKQGVVLELQAERSALKSRLLDMQARCTKAEQQLAAERDLEGNDDRDGANDEDSPLSGNGGLQRRGGKVGGDDRAPTTRVISDLERFGVKPGVGVAKAVNMIDAWAMLTGKFLRSYPLFRLGFMLYLLVLHLWVFFILILHMETLEMDSPEQQQQQLLHP